MSICKSNTSSDSMSDTKSEYFSGDEEMSISAEDNRLFAECLEWAEKSHNFRESGLEFYKEMEDNVRQGVVQLESENRNLKQGKAVLESDIAYREKQIEKCEQKCYQNECKTQSYLDKINEMETQLKAMAERLEETEGKISSSKREKLRIKDEIRDRLISERNRLKDVMDRAIGEVVDRMERSVDKVKLDLLDRLLRTESRTYSLCFRLRRIELEDKVKSGHRHQSTR